MSGAVCALGLLASGFQYRAVNESPSCELLVLTIRHERSDFPSRFVDFDAMKSKLEPMGYEIFRQKAEVLAVDRAIFARQPSVLQATLLDYFASRDYQSCKVAELPEVVRAAAIEGILKTLPEQTRESALSLDYSVAPCSPFTLKRPPGLGEDRYIESRLPSEIARGLKSPSWKPTFPRMASKGRPELRLFIPGVDSEARILPMWDHLRPLMRTREEQIEKEASASIAQKETESQRWLEEQLGVSKGEEVAFGSLSLVQKALIQRLTRMNPADLDGTRFKLEPGALRIEHGTGGNGTLSIDLESLGRI